jgi:hypothetical protein
VDDEQRRQASAPVPDEGVAARSHDLLALPAAAERGGLHIATTVLVVFSASLLAAIAKSIAAALTGSASLLAEAAHSWADTLNQVLMLIANRRSLHRRPKRMRRPASPRGRVSPLWSPQPLGR